MWKTEAGGKGLSFRGAFVLFVVCMTGTPP